MKNLPVDLVMSEFASGGFADYIPVERCEDNHLYFVQSRSIGELAVCRAVSEPGGVKFEGWRNKFGTDFVFAEYHWDDGGTLKPLAALERVTDVNGNVLLEWLLTRYIQLQEAKLCWLKNAPGALEDLTLMTADEQERLDQLWLVQQEGFSAHPMPTFREILQKKKDPAGS